MAEKSAAPKMTASQDLSDRKLRGDSSSWKQKITPTASEQLDDVSRQIPSASTQIDTTDSQIDDALDSRYQTTAPKDKSKKKSDDKSKSTKSKSNSLPNGLLSVGALSLLAKGVNSRGRSLGSALEKSFSDVDKLHTKAPAKQRSAEKSEELQR